MFALLVAVVVSQSPECRTSGLNQACGYNCRAELDQVACAQTPQGFCVRKERQLVCWDPPEEVRQHPPKSAPAPYCEAKYRDVACGYTCATSPNHLACAQTPWGKCTQRYDDVACWDPAPEVIHFFPAAELANAQCLSSTEGFACGWDCKRSYQDVRCAQTPRGKCYQVEGKLTCVDPPLPSVGNHVLK